MTDVLSYIRQFTISKKPIEARDGHVFFDKIAWPKTAKTSYIAWGTGQDGVPKKYYTLETILFFLQNVDLPHPVYVRQAASANLPTIRRPNRKDLIAYLNGERDASPSIDPNAPLQIAIQMPEQVKMLFT